MDRVEQNVKNSDGQTQNGQGYVHKNGHNHKKNNTKLFGSTISLEFYVSGTHSQELCYYTEALPPPWVEQISTEEHIFIILIFSVCAYSSINF